MRPFTCGMAIALLAIAVVAPAAAATCYIVYDRNGNVVYRDVRAPVDMSDAGAAARERMRSRGESLVFMETDRCPPVQYVFGGAGSRTLTVDQSVGGLAPGEGVASPSAKKDPPKRAK